MPQLTTGEIRRIYERNADDVYRVCFLFMRGRRADAEDAVQATFLKLIRGGKSFESREHERAWLIVAARSVCKTMLGSAWNRRVETVEGCGERASAADGDGYMLECVMRLPDTCKTAIYMFYYEGYDCAEIARSMGKSVNSVWGYLHRGRELLRQYLQEADV